MEEMIATSAFVLILKGGLIDLCNYGKVNSFEIGFGLFLSGFIFGFGMAN